MDHTTTTSSSSSSSPDDTSSSSCNSSSSQLVLSSIPNTVWSDIIEHYLTLTEGRRLLQTCHHFWNLSTTFVSHRRILNISSTTITSCTNTNSSSSNITNGGTNLQHEQYINDDIRYMIYPPICKNFQNVIILNLSHFATDTILFQLQNQLPNLQEIYMVGSGNNHEGGNSSSSSTLTDLGLLSLIFSIKPDRLIKYEQMLPEYYFDLVRCRNLRYIDITECSTTSYYITLVLREHIRHPNLIIRRIPIWMQGHFDTQYPDDGIHTYYADGSFLYDRSTSNCGYVCDLWKWSSSSSINSSPDHTTANDAYGDYLRFIKFDVPEPIMRLCSDLFYPGVTLCRYRGDDDDDDNDNESMNKNDDDSDDELSVVVVQSVNSVILPPESYRSPIFQNAPNSVLPLGQSMYRDVDGNVLSTQTDQALYRVTRMQKYPLHDMRYNNTSSKTNITDPVLQQPNSYQRNPYMPPDHIVNAIITAEEERMSNNRSQLAINNQMWWKNDGRLFQHINDINEIFFQHPCHMTTLDRFCHMIRRQKSMTGV